MPKNQVYDYALLRAAELTAEGGFKYFDVLDKSLDINIRKERLPAIPPRVEETVVDGPNGRTFTRKTRIPGTPSVLIDLKNPAWTLIISLSNSADQARISEGKSFDANATISRLKAKYRLK